MATPLMAFTLAVAAAAATLLGWVITASRRDWPPRLIGIVVILTAAAMCFISVAELLPAALTTGLAPMTVFLWVGVGAAVVVVIQRVAGIRESEVDRLQRSAAIVAAAMALHNIPEGAATVSATLISVEAGLITALAIAAHNIPEGIAISATVLGGGGSKRRALVLTAIATAGEVVGAAAALLFGGYAIEQAGAALLAAVAGVMICLSVIELAPAGVDLIRHPRETPAG